MIMDVKMRKCHYSNKRIIHKMTLSGNVYIFHYSGGLDKISQKREHIRNHTDVGYNDTLRTWFYSQNHPT